MTTNFDLREFACPCCGGNDIKAEFIEKLQKARSIAGIPFKIDSGWRCEAHNATLKDNSPNSSHLKGWAADIACMDNFARFKMIEAFREAGFNRFGIGKTYIHVDCDPTKPPKNTRVY